MKANGKRETQDLTDAIRAVGRSYVPDAAVAIEALLEERLSRLPRAESLHLLREIASQFAPSEKKTDRKDADVTRTAHEERITALLLGKEASRAGLSQEEISARLVKSLNTVFDTLNQIVGTIHLTLFGQQGEEETIRHVIGSEIKGETADKSLQGYLDQVQQSFLVSHKAFGLAVQTMVSQLLAELDPENLVTGEGRRRFGPLRKAELFEIYRAKHEALKKSFDSGRITEEFVREFERTCEKLFKKSV